MAFKREYESFFAVVMGMVIIMAAGTGMAATGDTDGSKPLLSMTEATTQPPFHVNLARITERKTLRSLTQATTQAPFPVNLATIPLVFAEMAITEQAVLKEAIFFLFFFLLLTSLLILCINRGFVKVIVTWRSI